MYNHTRIQNPKMTQKLINSLFIILILQYFMFEITKFKYNKVTFKCNNRNLLVGSQLFNTNNNILYILFLHLTKWI